jgi:hypothetical protein
MLKVTYLESSVYLEHLQETVEKWITLRIVLALRTGKRLVVERSTASLLLPIDLVKRSSLEAAAQQEEALSLSQVDAEYVEISLRGTWISSHEQGEGVFLAMLHPTIERLLFNLWQAAQVHPSSVWR